MKQTDNKITISADTLLNELMFCATRYCIGRKTYVNMYAEEYWRIIRDNRDKFNENRLKFFARDIRAEVSNVINLCDDVEVENAYNDRIVYDAFTLLYQYLTKQDVKREEVEYIVDCVSGEVTTKPIEKRNNFPFNIYEYEHDLLPWIRLANCIDRQYEVTCEHEGKTETAICIKDHNGTYHCIDRWSRLPVPEYITKVEPLFDKEVRYETHN